VGQFNFKKTPIEGLYIIEPKVFEDNRGYFMETYNYKDFKQEGLDMIFIQDNQSKSKKGVLRGMHFQTKHSQGKLVRVIKGEVFDVAIDLRKKSETYGRWHGVFLSEENKRQFYVPEGFAHGFLVISEEAEFVYKCTDFYYPEYEGCIAWNDPDIGILWPLGEVEKILLSEKDRKAPFLKECKVEF
jgi:dTDP-4-dehydrorhamnose 3,5-epimerase